MDRESILRMAQGSIEEKADQEVARVIDNILDLTTKPDAKRKITITLELTPDPERKHILLTAQAKSTLAPAQPVSTSLLVTADGNGELVIAEMVPQIPGQISMSGEEQPKPKLLKLVAQN